MRTKTFILNPKVVLRSEPQYYDTYIAYHWENSETLMLSKKEFQALNTIYSNPKSAIEAVDSLDISVEDCKKFYQGMKERGFVNIHDESVSIRSPFRLKIDQKNFNGFYVPFPSAPVTVDVFITDRCNLRCQHCFSYSNEEDNELPVKIIKKIFDELEEMGVLEVRLNGGEPFIHTDIDKILLDLAKRRFRRVIITNGTLLNEKAVQLLKFSKTIPTLSLDDSIPEEHDKFRGVKGSFEKTLSGMRLLKESGVDFGVNTCIYRGNLKRVGNIIDLAADYGASKVAILDLKNLGRMTENAELVPSPKEYRKAAIGLRLLKSIIKDLEVSSDVFMRCNPLRESIEELKHGYVSCSAGKTRLTIDSHASVYPCNMVISDKSWQMGNIKETKLYDIWFSKKWSFFRGGVKLEELKRCPDCPEINSCLDLYCRLYPYIKKGDLYALNPYCKRIKD